MDKLHHANIILSEDDSKDFVEINLVENLNFKTSGSPDFLFLKKESLGIDDAREFEKWAIKKPLSGNFKASLISVESITSEAQNAMLKVIEEPKEGTYFFIRIPNLGGILPTFLSRVRVLERGNRNKDNQNDSADKFMSLTAGARISLVQKLARSDKKGDMKEIISGLEKASYKDGVGYSKMKKIMLSKIYASAKGSSSKMLLEWLACVL